MKKKPIKSADLEISLNGSEVGFSYKGKNFSVSYLDAVDIYQILKTWIEKLDLILCKLEAKAEEILVPTPKVSSRLKKKGKK